MCVCVCVCVHIFISVTKHIMCMYWQRPGKEVNTYMYSRCNIASFPGLQSPNAVEGVVKLLRRMTSGGHLEAWLIALCMH